MEKLQLEISLACAKYAEKYQLEIMSIQLHKAYANFKEYDGDGFIKHKRTFSEILKA